MASDAGQAAVVLKRKDIKCTECAKEGSVYKCPACTKNYCSVECCNRHKLRCQQAPDGTVAIAGCSEVAKRRKEFKFPSEDTVPEAKLMEMSTNDRLTEMLKSQQLRKMIKEVDESPTPGNLLPHFLKDPMFSKFVTLISDIMKPGGTYGSCSGLESPD